MEAHVAIRNAIMCYISNHLMSRCHHHQSLFPIILDRLHKFNFTIPIYRELGPHINHLMSTPFNFKMNKNHRHDQYQLQGEFGFTKPKIIMVGFGEEKLLIGYIPTFHFIKIN